MRELGVRIDTPISALLTLNPRRVLSLFVSYSPVQSELHSTRSVVSIVVQERGWLGI